MCNQKEKLQTGISSNRQTLRVLDCARVSCDFISLKQPIFEAISNRSSLAELNFQYRSNNKRYRPSCRTSSIKAE